MAICDKIVAGAMLCIKMKYKRTMGIIMTYITWWHITIVNMDRSKAVHSQDGSGVHVVDKWANALRMPEIPMSHIVRVVN